MTNGLVRIVPGPNQGSGPCMTHGSQVLLPDGSAMKGVTRIVLTADINDVWRAEIHCTAIPPDVTCLASIARETAATRWQRMIAWLRYGKTKNR